MPKLREQEADGELDRVLGHALERPRARAARRRRRTTSAAAAAAAARPIRPCVAPNVMTMNDDLEPLEQHALEGDGERVPVDPVAGALAGRRGRALLLPERLGLVVLGLEAARAEDRLAQPLEPEDEQQAADDEPQRLDRDQLSSAGPSTATSAASTTSPRRRR